jgi:hypothetical protein
VIVSSCGLNNCVIDLDELFMVARSFIYVNVSSLEFLWPDDLLEWWSQSMKITPP